MGLLQTLFGKHVHLENKPLEEVKMKIKVTKSEPTPFGTYSGIGQPSSGTTITSKTPKKPTFLNIYSDKILKNSNITFVGMSKKTGYPVYELIGNDMSFLSGLKYTEVMMTPDTLSQKKQTVTTPSRSSGFSSYDQFVNRK